MILQIFSTFVNTIGLPQILYFYVNTGMTNEEKDALLVYLESQLLTLVQKSEEEGVVIGELYDLMYCILCDLEITIESNNQIVDSARHHKLPKRSG